VNAVFYVVKNGVTWRDLPKDFPPWKTVYHYFNKWSHSGLWCDINGALVEAARFAAGREESPSLVSIDSQSQSAEPGVEERGLDGNKKVNGRKRHIAVDVQGLLLLCYCTAANVSDVVGGELLIEDLNDTNFFPRLKKVLGDNAYRSVGKNARVPVSIESAERAHGQKGFVPEAFRWAVERTFAWLNRQRRLNRNYEKKVLHQESMNYVGNIRLCLNKLMKWLQ
jgi:putative transposase